MTKRNIHEIVVVSGLPRSGTSLMMQILAAWNIPLLTDDQRLADPSNPNGYFELEKVKSLPDDTSWLCSAEGHAVKIISPLLYWLPSDLHFKVIFMHRDLTEIVTSQSAMQDRLGTRTEINQPSLIHSYRIDLERIEEWLSLQKNMTVYHCDYNLLMLTPSEELTGLAAFLGLDANIAAAEKVINPELYHCRSQR